MADWSVVAAAGISGASALGGAALGYLTAVRQSGADLARLRAEHDEAHLQHRQAVYHDFLDSAHRFHQDAGGIEPFDTPDGYREWARTFEHHLSAVRLF